MDKQQQAAINGAANAPLSREQKRNICMVAERAWRAQGSPFWEPAQDPAVRLARSSALELWRHVEQERLTGRKHLTACGQCDYELLLAHFARLAGDGRAAERAEARMSGDDTRRAMAVLRREMFAARRQIADPRRYVETIARSKYKAGLDGLTTKQLWTVIFDLRRAVSARRKKAAMEKAPF